MLFVHEVHAVHGDREDEFEAHVRDGWMPALAKSGNARVRHGILDPLSPATKV